MKKKLLIGAGIVVIAGITLFAIFNPWKKTGTEVYAAKVEAGEVRSVVTASGEIQAKTKVNISANVWGQIEAIPVKEGDIVGKGRILLEIDPEQYQTQARSLEATVRMAKVALEQEENRNRTLESQLRRAEGLRSQGILPEESFEQVQLSYDSSTIQIKSLREAIAQAEAALAKARDELSKTTIYAPMDGKITQLNTEVGEQVIVGTTNIPGSTMMVISDMSEVLAEVDVDETEVVKVKVGQPVAVTVDAVEKMDYKGCVTEIRNSATTKNDANVFGVKVLLENADDRLRPGMSAKARIEIERREKVIRVPIQAVLERSPKQLDEEIAKAGGKAKGKAGSGTAKAAEGSAAKAGTGKDEAKKDEAKKDKEDETVDVVYILEGGKAQPVRVTTGLTDESHVEILAGLKEGQSVITGPYRSLRKLKAGDKVTEKKEEELKVEESEEKKAEE